MIKQTNATQRGMPTLEDARRTLETMLTEGLIKTQVTQRRSSPLMIQPSTDEIHPAALASSNREWIETQLLKHGALLIRNFNVGSLVGFDQFITAIAGELYEYGDEMRDAV